MLENHCFYSTLKPNKSLPILSTAFIEELNRLALFSRSKWALLASRSKSLTSILATFSTTSSIFW